jgi:hypothetical protein
MSVTHIDTSDAERRALKISLRLDSIADNFEAVMPMIREALELGDHLALGYRSPGEYLSTRFGNALERLPLVMRREAVRELTAAGLSTRAIAPVVGVSHMTAARDLAAGVTDVTPEPDYVTDESDLPVVTGRLVDEDGEDVATLDERGWVNTTTGEITDEPPAKVTGIDGKKYPRATPSAPKSSREAPGAALSLVNDVRLYLHTLATSPQVAELSPTAKSHIITALQDAIDTLKGMS